MSRRLQQLLTLSIATLFAVSASAACRMKDVNVSLIWKPSRPAKANSGHNPPLESDAFVVASGYGSHSQRNLAISSGQRLDQQTR